MCLVNKLPISSAAILCQPRLIVCFRTRLSVRIEGKDFPVRVRAEYWGQRLPREGEGRALGAKTSP